MIINDKKPLPDDPTPVDAPPSYDDIASSPGPSSSRQQGREGTAKDVSRYNFFGGSVARAGPSNSGRSSAVASPRIPRPTPAPVTAPTPKSQNDVHQTVRGLVRDLLQTPALSAAPDAAAGVLESCAHACAAQGLVFASVLQEKSIEGHTPLYWAVVKKEGADALMMQLLKFAAPLTPTTLSELRLACLVRADNALLQRLRASPAFTPLRGTDAMLLSGDSRGRPEKLSTFADIVEIRESGDAQAGAFGVRLALAMFQRRMRVSKEIAVEFVARGRLWGLTFFVVPAVFVPIAPPSAPASNAPDSMQRSAVCDATLAAARTKGLAPGTWAVCLSLLEHSPQCWVDAQLLVAEPPPPAPSPPPLPPRRPSRRPRSQDGGEIYRQGHSLDVGGLGQVHSRSASASRVSLRKDGDNVELVDFSASYPTPSPSPGTGLAQNPLLSYLPRQLSVPLLNASASFPSLSPSSPRPQYDFPPPPPPPKTGNGNARGCRSNSTPKRKPKPTISLRIKCDGGPLTAPPPPPDVFLPLTVEPASYLSMITGTPSKSDIKAKLKREAKEAKEARAREARAAAGKETKQERGERVRLAGGVAVAGLEENLTAGTLMYDGCSYIASDGSLRAILEARLAKPEAECIIC